jgi:hypothetical protein
MQGEAEVCRHLYIVSESAANIISETAEQIYISSMLLMLYATYGSKIG